jgi:hypothetical protein
MNKQAYINGFVKRAAQYGVSQVDALFLLKQAFPNFNIDPKALGTGGFTNLNLNRKTPKGLDPSTPGNNSNGTPIIGIGFGRNPLAKPPVNNAPTAPASAPTAPASAPTAPSIKPEPTRVFRDSDIVPTAPSIKPEPTRVFRDSEPEMYFQRPGS